MAKSKIIISKNAEEIAQTMGLSKSATLEWKVRYQITNKIIDVIKQDKWTISAVAKMAGTSRARITQIMKSDTGGISIDVLLRVLGALGNSIKISFKKVA